MELETLQKLVSDYCGAWAISEFAEREERLRLVVVDDVVYCDPSVHAVGVRRLSEHIATVIARYPNSVIELTSDVDVHHGFLRFGWKKVLQDGTSLPEGIDFCRLAPEGKLATITGFFGPLRPQRPVNSA